MAAGPLLEAANDERQAAVLLHCVLCDLVLGVEQHRFHGAHGGHREIVCTSAFRVHAHDIVTNFVGPALCRRSWDTCNNQKRWSQRAAIHELVLHLWGVCYLRCSWGYRGQRVGEAANPGPGGSRRTIRCREERRSPFAGQRIGEAANPGPAVNDDQMKMLMSLLQLILQLVTQLASGGGADVKATVAAANQTLQGIAGGSRETAQPPARTVSIEDEWQLPKRRRGRGRQQVIDSQGAVGHPPPQEARPVVLQPPGKGQGKASLEPKGKGKGKGVAPVARAVPPVQGKGGLRADDWIGKLVSFEDLSVYSAEGESVVVEACDATQASVAQAMIRGAGLKSSFLIVYPDPEGKQKAPFWQGGVVTMRPVIGFQVPHGAVALPTLKGKKAEKTIKMEASVVVRVIVARDFCPRSEWTAAKKGFRAFVTSKLGIMDAWGAAEEQRLGETIVGLVRARSASLSALLARSGQDGIFVEPIGKDPTGPNYGVKWIEKEEAEELGDYFKRAVASKPSHGLVIGRRQLGTRAVVARENQARAWRLMGAPKHWGTDSITEVLEEAGYKELSLNSRMLRRGQCTWFFRATAKEDFCFIPIKEGQDEIELHVLPATSARQQPGRKPLRQERTQQFVKERFSTTSGATRGALEEGADGKAQPEGKRRAQEVREVPQGTQLKEQPKDGNCLAHCIGAGLSWAKNDGKRRPARLVRAELHNYMREKKDSFAAWWDGRDCSDKPATYTGFDAYLDEMKGDGQFLGCLEIEAACLAFDLTITVIPVAADQLPTKHGSGKHAFCLWYSGSHYDLLLPTAGSYPSAVNSVQCFGCKSGGRGGGPGDADDDVGDDDELDALTIYTAATGGGRKPRPKRSRPQPQLKDSSPAAAEVVSQVPSLGAGTGGGVALSEGPMPRPTSVLEMLRRPPAASCQASGSSDQAADSSLVGGVSFCAASRDDEIASQDLDHVEPPPPVPARRRAKRTSWKCKFCDFETKVGLATAAIDHARLKHLHKWHMDRKAHWTSFCRWRFKATPDARDNCAGQQEVLWQCKHCTAGVVGIKLKDRKQAGAVYLAAVKHCRDCHPQEIKAWRRDRRHANFKKATAVRRAAGVAGHLMRRKALKYGEHDVIMFRIPWLRASSGGKQRKSIASYVCRRCAAQATTPANMMQHHCDPGRMPVGRGRTQFVSRLTQALEQDHSEELKQGIRGVLQVFDEVAVRLKEARIATAKAEGVTEHHIQAIAWPKLTADSTSFAVRFVCQRCHYHASLRRHFKGIACSAVGKRRQTAEKERLMEIVNMEDPAGSAARLALRYLGHELPVKGGSGASP